MHLVMKAILWCLRGKNHFHIECEAMHDILRIFIDRMMHCRRYYGHKSHFSATASLSVDWFDTIECSKIDRHLIPLASSRFRPVGRTHSPVSLSVQWCSSEPFAAYRFSRVLAAMPALRLRPLDWIWAFDGEVDRMRRSNDAFACVLGHSPYNGEPENFRLPIATIFPSI